MNQYIKTVIQPQHRRLLFAFGLYMYFYLEAEILFTIRIGERLSESIGTVFYGLFCLAAAIGFFSYAFIRRLIHGMDRPALLTLAGVGAISTLSAAYTGAWQTAVFTLISMLIAGIVGASLLYAMAIRITEKSVLGLFIALPYAAAFLLQYILGYISPIFDGNEPLFWHFTIAAALCAAPFLAPKIVEMPIQKQKTQPGANPETRRYLVGVLIAGFIIFCLYGMMDGIIMTLHAGQELNVYGWARLIAIPGILFTGWVADFHEGKYFPFASAVGMTAAIAAVFLFNTEETFNAALGSVYFFCSFMTMYSLVVFIRVADSTVLPAFWAAAGRGLKYLAGGIFALTGSLIFSNTGLLQLALIYLGLMIALYIVLFFQGKLTPVEIVPPQPNIPFEQLVEKYGFTPRETELLELLLTGQSTTEIASKMVLTENTVHKYVSSMIQKSKSESRAILVAKFAGQRK